MKNIKQSCTSILFSEADVRKTAQIAPVHNVGITLESIFYVLHFGFGFVSKQCVHGHNNAWSAKATLGPMTFCYSLLKSHNNNQLMMSSEFMTVLISFFATFLLKKKKKSRNNLIRRSETTTKCSLTRWVVSSVKTSKEGAYWKADI